MGLSSHGPNQEEEVTENDSLVLALMSILFEIVYSNLHLCNV